ncbi:hypothetical protein N7481_002313 [Penicillium waksmanii]|uniref:uncharacterized protein n=1 Tax=Penicillium waksmanii TaxID=69791 RepID=UPI002548D858|nr:uncharacterized protein N7481_002313 [Penicillium waksmanii]KAJ5995336.1 hypothetical protein N7481_002313 [Penicillium waksmanii]
MELKNLLLTEPHCEFWGSISGYEHIDYVYSCALVCILGFVYTDSGPESSKDNTRSNLQSTLTQLLDLFHKYEVRCIQNRKLITLMGRCKYALQGLADFVLTLEPGSVSNLGLSVHIWKDLFLRINQPFAEFPFVTHPSRPPITFAWFESVPADLADQHAI